MLLYLSANTEKLDIERGPLLSMLSSASTKYDIEKIESLQNCKQIKMKFSVPELFEVSDLDRTIRLVRQLNSNNVNQISKLLLPILSPELVEPFVKAGFDRIVYNHEFAKPFCYCCLSLYRQLQSKELYAELMKVCQTYFTNRQQWVPLEKILITKKKTNQVDVPKMEKKTKMTKRRSYATIYFASALLEIKFMSPTIFFYILKECLKGAVPDDVELASVLIESTFPVVERFSSADKAKLLEVLPRLQQLAQLNLLPLKSFELVNSLQ